MTSEDLHFKRQQRKLIESLMPAYLEKVGGEVPKVGRPTFEESARVRREAWNNRTQKMARENEARKLELVRGRE